MAKKKQKYRKQKQKKIFPWLFVLVGGGLLLLASVLFANQSGGNGSGTPNIAVNQQRIDYGEVKFGVNKTFAIKVTNAGDGTLRFTEEPYIEVLEGC
jgi:hypothetical protein